MKVAERDELLIRLDVKMGLCLETLDKQEKHLAHLNNKVVDNRLNIDRNHNRIGVLEDMAQNGTSLRLSRKQVATGSAGAGGVGIMLLMALGKISGWW